MDNRAPSDKFVTANNVRMHYLDWGGQGPYLLLLPGLGGSARIFTTFAPKFTDSFHVLGLTRRDHGQSQSTEGPYDIDTLVADIQSFLDAIGIERVKLMGHSMAGDEMSRFACVYPDQIIALVYLDAAHDRSTLAEILSQHPLVQDLDENPPEERWESVEDYFNYMRRRNPFINERWDVWEKELFESVSIHPDGTVTDRFPPSKAQKFIAEVSRFSPDFRGIKCSALSVVAMSSEIQELPEEMLEETRIAAAEYHRNVMVPWHKEQVQRFIDEVEHGEVLIQEGANHYVFLDREDDIVPQIHAFLREIVK